MTAAPIILDTDIGTDVDDAFALVMAVRKPHIDLRAVTTVYGDVDLRARMARKLLNLVGQPDIPVAAGEAQPLYDGKDSYWGGWEGVGFLTEADAGLSYDPRPAVRLMRETLLGTDQPLTLVGIGPLTNFAHLIRQHPEVRPQIKEIVCMAGSLRPNDEEWNVQCDPEAAKIMLESGLPLRLGTRHFVNQPWLTQKERQILRSRGDAVVQVLVDLLDEFLSHKTRTHSPMYDPVTLSMVYTDAFLPTVPKHFRIRMEQQILYLDVMDAPGEETRMIRVPTAVHPQAFIDDLVRTLVNE
jgi:purine nucleosidase